METKTKGIDKNYIIKRSGMKNLLRATTMVILLLSSLSLMQSCGKVETPEEFFDITGDKGSDGSDGADGIDGADAEFQLVGRLGTYVEKGEDIRDFNLTCMLGDSQESDRTVLRIITGEGGLINVRRAGRRSEDVYLPANTSVFLYGKKNGTYIIDNGTVSKTKACNP